jgi:hypothetical protein
MASNNGDVVSNMDESKKPSEQTNTSIHVAWSPENESILVEWCDVAQCYKWLNSRCHSYFSYMHAWFTIPAIVLSTITGTASFAQTSLPLQYQTYSPMAIGTINILIGILSTVQQYLKISELNEAHRVSSIAWDKFARNIRIELAKIPDERMDAGHFIKLSRQEFDRLMETSPSIPEKFTKEFNYKFRGKDPESIANFKNLKKPDICDTIVSVNETRNKWYVNTKEYQDEHVDDSHSVVDLGENLDKKDEVIELQQRMIREKEEELQRRKLDDMEKSKHLLEELANARKEQEKQKKKQEDEMNSLKKYVVDFEESCGRKPLKDEIYESMKDIVNISSLNSFLENYGEDNV